MRFINPESNLLVTVSLYILYFYIFYVWRESINLLSVAQDGCCYQVEEAQAKWDESVENAFLPPMSTILVWQRKDKYKQAALTGVQWFSYNDLEGGPPAKKKGTKYLFLDIT